MYYCKQTNRYYENDEAILRHLIFLNRLYESGFEDHTVEEQDVELIPGVVCKKKVFIIYSENHKRRNKKTVFEIANLPPYEHFFNVEHWIEHTLNDPSLWTDYGKFYYRQVLEHFKNNPTIRQLKNNLFIEQNRG